MNWQQTISNALVAAIGVNAIGYCLAAIGLNVHFGYTGLLNFGQAGFALLGAYAVAVPVRQGWSFWWSLGFVVLVPAIFALALGIPTLRLRSDYLAIVTIAAAEILRLIVSTPSWNDTLGGTDGINSFTGAFSDANPISGSDITIWKTPVPSFVLWVMICGWVLVLLFSVLVWTLTRSPWGRVLKSIREDEDAARSLGKNVFTYKMVSLVLGGVVGAFGGLVLAVGNRIANPVSFRTEMTFFVYAILVLGGVGKVRGPIAGAMIFWFVISFTEGALANATDDKGYKLPEWLVTANNYGFVRFMLVGLGLALLVVFRPQGIFGDRKEQAFDVR